MKKSVLIGVMLLFLMAACGGAQPDLVTSAVDVTGIWSLSSGLQFIRFDADGTLHMAPSLTLVTNPPVRPPAQYWFEDDQLHIETPEDDICGAVTAVYEVRLLENGNLSFVVVEDACEHRVAWMQGVIDEETGEPYAEFAPLE